MNVSPATLLTPECGELLGRLPLHRGSCSSCPSTTRSRTTPRCNAALRPFRAGGMRLAIDDVGAGFSSLRHIVVTSPDVIKIDRSIVTGLNTDPVLTKLVQSLVEFGHGCRVRVVAEGVETAGEAAALRTLGVDYGQGWHLRPSRPAGGAHADPAAAAPRTPDGRTVAAPEPASAGEPPPLVGLRPVHRPVGPADQLVGRSPPAARRRCRR